MKESKRNWYKKWAKTHSHPCPDCGKPILPNSERCRSCTVKHRWEEIGSQSFFKGEHRGNWKGGRWKTSTGYIMIYKPDHPRANKAGYVREHILIWEETHGKPLPKGWIVHHLNGRKDDNRPINLAGIPSKKHYLMLQAKAKRIQELEALLNNQHQLL